MARPPRTLWRCRFGEIFAYPKWAKKHALELNHKVDAYDLRPAKRRPKGRGRKGSCGA